MDRLPRWADLALVPLISLLLAAIISALVILAIGQDPWEAITVMVQGSLMSAYGWGYTLYYTTSFIFTGLCVTIAFHAGLFNIGGEGQAQLGGLGVALACLFIPWPHWSLALIGASLAAAAFGAAWIAIPAWLQARRGSHIVITTIMFNYIASSLMIFMLVDVLRPPGQQDPSTANFPAVTHIPSLDELPLFNLIFTKPVPANISLLIALAVAAGVWVLLWHTRLGYQIRAFGKSEAGARYAGISATKITMIALMLSGALAGMMAINNVMGEAERLVGNSASGAGFIGIAVALMGRNHPIGVVLAALLFGFLFQGGAELGMWTKIPIEMRIVVQGLVILFTGALDMMVRMMLTRIFALFRNPRPVGAA
ncbi:ABC transporter permease [Pseudogemmobacter blasticus]|uniref:Sugar ABC transporter permease n=1 Tax=Fuscovulum blasticum DSM 2131 TaxID=1188250 RepID=A0A2T4JCK0_FUSBL|nr:ABC transporter permease [Fuscovulum blasticum]AWD21445.1 sugar ABC transporter permease [Fuscovulum blasticum]PTE15621.1 sugar ABC transporter permease [Fuscovulum blasticum DSM 2131]